MSEGLFILTTIFVAYVVYVIIGDSKADKSAKPAAAAKKPQPAKRTAAKPAARATAATRTTAATKAAAPKSRATSKPKTQTKPAAESSSSNELKNPETGEVSAIASNYRFMKRWIKDALVAEGLIDKVYKNTELDTAAETKIKTALGKIKKLDKYKA